MIDQYKNTNNRTSQTAIQAIKCGQHTVVSTLSESGVFEAYVFESKKAEDREGLCKDDRRKDMGILPRLVAGEAWKVQMNCTKSWETEVCRN